MITRKNSKNGKLTPMQRHDVWEVKDVDEITEEVQKVMKSMGLSTEEVDKVLPQKKEKK
tara:strand:- start:1711 stop:1887 length:177 start_codon:yes stop_codon:yes gene_type:complete